ncbi:BglG family transcription antiterminator [Streptomyces sp. NPDC002795]|uniref:BglG family transcription antiterminator n=1 Tax=Streptomyces sp. NPDC002795 TaxID=3364665 RepID=UPI0036BA2F2B
MSENRHAALIAYLRQVGGLVPAAEAASALGVTARSVRGYVSRINAASPRPVIVSTPAGYRLDEEALAASRTSPRTLAHGDDTPQGRLVRLFRRLNDAPEGIGFHELAEDFHVSDATLEADLGKARRRLEPLGLRLRRDRESVRMEGPEDARRRLISTLLREEAAEGFLPFDAIQRAFAGLDLGPFKAELVGTLSEVGYSVKEFALNEALLHIAIAVDRTTKFPAPAATSLDTPPSDAPGDQVTTVLRNLIEKFFGLRFDGGELDRLAAQLTTRALAAAGRPTTPPEESDLAKVRALVARLDDEYLVDFSDPGFVTRLSVHVHNLLGRARRQMYNRNPLAASIKTSYPLIYELAVYLSREIQREWQVALNEDEIAYVAMHVGAHLEAQAVRPRPLTAVLVCPEYYELATTLGDRLGQELGSRVEITRLVTRLEDVPDIKADVVISTLPIDAHPGAVVVRPFPGRRDFDAVRAELARVQHQREHGDDHAVLLDYLRPELFFRDLHAENETAMIRLLGSRMAEQGVIDPEHIDSVLERERLSSTAFTDGFAVPHAMTMNAHRSAIALVVNSEPMRWGNKPVNVIAFIAFSPRDRSTFRAAFEKFTAVLSERSAVHLLVKRAVDHPSFVREIRALLAE